MQKFQSDIYISLIMLSKTNIAIQCKTLQLLWRIFLLGNSYFPKY